MISRIILALGLASCAHAAPTAPTAAQEARVATYSEALEACDTKLALDVREAKAKGNADRRTLLASYEACAHAADVAWGRAK